MGTQTDNAGAQGASNLVVIAGHWNIKKSRAVYEGPEQQNMPYGICVSDLRFSEGKAWVTVTRTKDVPIQARILLAYRSQQHEYLSAGLGGGGGAYAIVRYVPPFGWHPLTADGSEKSLPPVGQPIVICARIQGQQISLEIDDVPVLEHVLSAHGARSARVAVAEPSCRRQPGRPASTRSDRCLRACIVRFAGSAADAGRTSQTGSWPAGLVRRPAPNDQHSVHPTSPVTFWFFERIEFQFANNATMASIVAKNNHWTKAQIPEIATSTAAQWF